MQYWSRFSPWLVQVLAVLIQVQSLGLQLVAEFVQHVGGFAVDHGLRQFEGVGFVDLLQHLVLAFVFLGVLQGLFQLLADILLYFFERIEFRNVLGEFIVQFGQFLRLDFVDPALEDGGLACQFFGVIFFGERHFHVLRVAGLAAYELFLETGDELSGTQDERLVLGGAAFELLLFAPAFIVQHDGVAVLCGSVHDDQARVSLLHRLQFAFDVLFVQFLLGHFDLNALVVLDDDFGSDGDGDGDFEALALLQLFFAEGKVRSVDRFQRQLVQRRGIAVRQTIVDRVFEEDAFAVSLFDDAAGSLALAEARHLDLASLGLICLIQGRVEFFRRKGHGEFCYVVFLAN